jgi:DNA polymerase III subunit epsilon
VNTLNKIAVFDLETTGLDLANSKIVTACVAIIDLNGNLIGEANEWLADPGIEIPAIAASVHGVTTEHARAHGRPLAEVVSEINAKLAELFGAGIPVVAYNASYDFTILQSNALALGLPALEAPMPVLDPLVLDRRFDKWRKGKRTLTASTELYGVALGEDAHNATADAIAAGRVALAVLNKFKLLDEFTLEQLHENQVIWSLEQDQSFNRFLAGQGKPLLTQFGWPVKAL